MQISVIIPTYNGAHRILTVLGSMARQTVKPDEVLVIIDGSTDNTKALILPQDFRDINLRIVERENGGRAKVRNTGAEKAQYELLLFIDDDMIAPDNWVAEHKALHEHYSNVIVTGRLEDPTLRIDTDFLKFKTWLHEKWTKDFVNAGEDIIALTSPYITANNMSVPASVFRQLQGFDDRLRDAEDYDMAVRALRANIRLFFSRTAYAVNNDIDNVSCERYIKRIREYTAAQEHLRKLKPDLYGERHQYATPPPSGLKGMIFKIFCSSFWIKAVDRGYLRFLPRELRFKLYDVIITANGSYFTDKVHL